MSIAFSWDEAHGPAWDMARLRGAAGVSSSRTRHTVADPSLRPEHVLMGRPSRPATAPCHVFRDSTATDVLLRCPADEVPPHARSVSARSSTGHGSVRRIIVDASDARPRDWATWRPIVVERRRESSVTAVRAPAVGHRCATWRKRRPPAHPALPTGSRPPPPTLVPPCCPKARLSHRTIQPPPTLDTPYPLTGSHSSGDYKTAHDRSKKTGNFHSSAAGPPAALEADRITPGLAIRHREQLCQCATRACGYTYPIGASNSLASTDNTRESLLAPYENNLQRILISPRNEFPFRRSGRPLAIPDNHILGVRPIIIPQKRAFPWNPKTPRHHLSRTSRYKPTRYTPAASWFLKRAFINPAEAGTAAECSRIPTPARANDTGAPRHQSPPSGRNPYCAIPEKGLVRTTRARRSGWRSQGRSNSVGVARGEKGVTPQGHE